MDVTRLIWALIANGALAGTAFVLKMVSPSGVIGGFMVGTVIYYGVDWPGYLILFGFFIFASCSTKLGYKRKTKLGVAQEGGGKRGAKNAMANCSTGLICAVGYMITKEPLWLIAYTASFATALSDTLGSEMGQLYGKHPILITSLKPVPIGTEGAVSIEGTLIGIAGSFLLPIVGLVAGLFGSHYSVYGVLGCVAAGAFIGTTAESYLGATIEGFKGIDNEVINFLNTVIGAAAAAGLAALLL